MLCRQLGSLSLQTDLSVPCLSQPSDGLLRCTVAHCPAHVTNIPNCPRTNGMGTYSYLHGNILDLDARQFKLQCSQCWPLPLGLALSLQRFANRGEQVSQTSSYPRLETLTPTNSEQPSLMGTSTSTLRQDTIPASVCR